jgi:hypothetical protein
MRRDYVQFHNFRAEGRYWRNYTKGALFLPDIRVSFANYLGYGADGGLLTCARAAAEPHQRDETIQRKKALADARASVPGVQKLGRYNGRKRLLARAPPFREARNRHRL